MARNTCANNTLYQDLTYCKGKTILPGIRPLVAVIPKADIVKWPVLPNTPSGNMGSIAKYAEGNFTLASDKYWKLIDLTLNKGQITWETQGDKPSRTFLNKAPLEHPEINESAAGFARQAIADDLVFAIQQRDGKWRILGNELFDTDVKVSGGTGEGVSGEVGTKIEVEVTDVCPAPFYTGKLKLSSTEEIDCSQTSTPIV